MSSSKLFKLLSSLESKEISRFQVFLKSPFFNQSDKMVTLFNYIRKYHPGYDHPKLQKENIQKALGKPLPYQQKFVNDSISELSKLAEEFLIVQQTRTDKPLRDKVFRKALIDRNQYELFKKESENEIKRLKKKKDNSWSHHWDLWSLQYQLFKQPQTNKWDFKNDPVEEMIPHLDEAYRV